MRQFSGIFKHFEGHNINASQIDYKDDNNTCNMVFH